MLQATSNHSTGTSDIILPSDLLPLRPNRRMSVVATQPVQPSRRLSMEYTASTNDNSVKKMMHQRARSTGDVFGLIIQFEQEQQQEQQQQQDEGMDNSSVSRSSRLSRSSHELKSLTMAKTPSRRDVLDSSADWTATTSTVKQAPQTTNDQAKTDSTNNDGLDGEGKVYISVHGKRRRERTSPHRRASRSRSTTRLPQREAKVEVIATGNVPSTLTLGDNGEDAERMEARRRRRGRRRQQMQKQQANKNNGSSRSLRSMPNLSLHDHEDTAPPQNRRSRSTGHVMEACPPLMPQRLASMPKDDPKAQERRRQRRERQANPEHHAVRRNKSANDLVGMMVGGDKDDEGSTIMAHDESGAKNTRSHSSPPKMNLPMMSRKKESLDASSFPGLVAKTSKDRPSCKPSRRVSTTDVYDTSGDDTSDRTSTTRSNVVSDEEEEEDDDDYIMTTDYDDSNDDDDRSETSFAEGAELLALAGVMNKRLTAGQSTSSSLTVMSPWACICGEENEPDANFCGMCASPKKWTCMECHFANNKCKAIFCGGCATKRLMVAA